MSGGRVDQKDQAREGYLRAPPRLSVAEMDPRSAADESAGLDRSELWVLQTHQVIVPTQAGVNNTEGEFEVKHALLKRI